MASDAGAGEIVSGDGAPDRGGQQASDLAVSTHVDRGMGWLAFEWKAHAADLEREADRMEKLIATFRSRAEFCHAKAKEIENRDQ